jgi:hypothetical protein
MRGSMGGSVSGFDWMTSRICGWKARSVQGIDLYCYLLMLLHRMQWEEKIATSGL